MQLTILMQPVPKGRPRFTRGGFAYTPTKTRTAEKFIKAFIQGYPKLPADIPLAMTVTFYFLRPKTAKKRQWHTVKPDLTNLVKTVEDAANGILYNDDSQIVRMLIRKEYGDVARVEITIEEVK
jgi:Holliday junction resolvase RusA-like endonuclease